MPTSIVIKLVEDVAKLKAQVANLIWYQKWQMGLLAAILAAVFGTWITR